LRFVYPAGDSPRCDFAVTRDYAYVAVRAVRFVRYHVAYDAILRCRCSPVAVALFSRCSLHAFTHAAVRIGYRLYMRLRSTFRVADLRVRPGLSRVGCVVGLTYRVYPFVRYSRSARCRLITRLPACRRCVGCATPLQSWFVYRAFRSLRSTAPRCVTAVAAFCGRSLRCALQVPCVLCCVDCVLFPPFGCRCRSFTPHLRSVAFLPYVAVRCRCVDLFCRCATTLFARDLFVYRVAVDFISFCYVADL